MTSDQIVHECCMVLRTSPKYLNKCIETLINEIKVLTTQLKNTSPPVVDVVMVGDVKLLSCVVRGFNSKELRVLADEYKKQIGSGIVVVIGTGM